MPSPRCVSIRRCAGLIRRLPPSLAAHRTAPANGVVPAPVSPCAVLVKGVVPVLVALCGALAYGLTPAVAAPAATLSAQTPTPVPGEVTCADCVITLDTIATIGGWEDAGLHVITPFSQVAVDRRGRILVTHLSYPEISVFSPEGDYVGTVGRGGTADGEYEAIAHVNVGGRYIHVFEFQRGVPSWTTTSRSCVRTGRSRKCCRRSLRTRTKSRSPCTSPERPVSHTSAW